jgi:ABC-type multidrug transport system permease subunit
MEENNLARPLGQKIQADTERQSKQFTETRNRDRAKRRVSRKMEVQAAARQSHSKEIKLGETYAVSANDLTKTIGNHSILIGLGLTVSFINDFSDLATWQSMALISQSLDLVALLLLLFVVGFSSRTYFVAVLLFLIAFVLEILPVLGIFPWWIIAAAAFCVMERKK